MSEAEQAAGRTEPAQRQLQTRAAHGHVRAHTHPSLQPRVKPKHVWGERTEKYDPREGCAHEKQAQPDGTSILPGFSLQFLLRGWGRGIKKLCIEGEEFLSTSHVLED